MTWHIYRESEVDLHLRGNFLCPCYARTHMLPNGDFLIVHNTIGPNTEEAEKSINLAINYILNINSEDELL